MTTIIEESYYLDGYRKKDMVVLSRLISLIESSNANHQQLVEKLFKKFKPSRSYVLGITGTPGAGKSTLINHLGQNLVNAHKKLKLAIIAVDPSSEITGGSILGDKTRMAELNLKNNVYIRPLASKGSYGGVTPRVEKIIAAMKSWKFDFIIVETLGIGQAESNIYTLVDDLVLVVPPATGDDLQAMKRGILELVDGLCINKIDLVSEELSRNSLRQYENSLSFLRSKEIPIFLCNATISHGIDLFSLWVEKRFNEYWKRRVSSRNKVRTQEKLLVTDLEILFRTWYKKNLKNIRVVNNKSIFKKFASYLLANK